MTTSASETAPAADGTRIRFVGILDTETTSLEPPPKGRTIEIAVCLYDLKYAQPVASYASLIRVDGNEEYGMPLNPAEHINGIPGAMLAEAQEPDLVWRAVRWLIAPASVLLCHRAEFDRQFVPPDIRDSKPFVCSKVDISWGNDRRGDSLVQLALSLGLGVASAHRAAADVDLLSRILTRVAERGQNLEALILHAMRPKVRYVSLAPFEQKDVVKQWGFLWEPQRKEWYRYMPPSDVGELPFKVRT